MYRVQKKTGIFVYIAITPLKSIRNQKEGWKIQHKCCMELWPSKQGSLFFWDTLYVHIELKLICETDFRVWSCSFYVWTDLELVILLCIVSSPSNRSEVYKVRSQKICCEISCIDCHLSKFKGHRSDCIITIFPGNFTRFSVFYSFCFIVNCPFCPKRNTPIHCGRWVGGGP